MTHYSLPRLPTHHGDPLDKPLMSIHFPYLYLYPSLVLVLVLVRLTVLRSGCVLCWWD